MSERFLFHLDRENLPAPVARLVRATERALLDAAGLLQAAPSEKRERRD